MANPEHVAIATGGARVILNWREKNRWVQLDLRDADLRKRNLRNVDLRGADLTRADLSESDLSRANLTEAKLTGSKLTRAVLGGADPIATELALQTRDSTLTGTNFRFADLSDADLRGAFMLWTNLSGATLTSADFTELVCGWSVFVDVDLSRVRGMESARHVAPSNVGIDTIYKSQGKIPEAFLRGCGVPDSFIAIIRSLVGATEPIQFNSCFISYSSKDEEFARRLYSRMRDQHLRVWFAPEEMKGGQKLVEQLDQAIQVNDRLLLVLSEASMRSEWVQTEIRRARRAERNEGRRKLFPIRLVNFDAIRAWECFDADTGKDLAVELREYFIPDFSNWKSTTPSSKHSPDCSPTCGRTKRRGSSSRDRGTVRGSGRVCAVLAR